MAIIEVITNCRHGNSECLLMPENPILNSKTVVKTTKFKTLFLKFIGTLQLDTWDKCKTIILVSFHVYGFSLHLT